jgi:FkbM family methyltransferase
LAIFGKPKKGKHDNGAAAASADPDASSTEGLRFNATGAAAPCGVTGARVAAAGWATATEEEEGDAEEVLVPVKTIDTLVRSNSNIDLIKIDVEGFEFEVVQGGLELIESSKPTIVIELLRKWMKPFGKQPQDVINLLKPLGYEVFSIGSSHLTLITVIDESTIENNFIFIHPDNSKHLNILPKNFTIE